jgi:hypothetical protein
MITTLNGRATRSERGFNTLGDVCPLSNEIDAAASRVTIVGTGMECASWAANFLAHGADVVMAAPAEEIEETMRSFVAAAWPVLSKMGLAPGASPTRLKFQSDLRKALVGADLVLWCRRVPRPACFATPAF